MHRQRILGLSSLAVAVVIWAGWIVVVRASVTRETAPLGALDIAVLRYVLPAVLLAPVWRRCGVWPAGLGAGRLAAMVLGWGAPFAVLGATGLAGADSTLFAALVPGSMPLWLLLILTVIDRRVPPLRATLGGVMIAAAALGAVALAVAEGRGVVGAPWLVAASLGWAGYAAAYRGSTLTPVEATAVVAFWSTLGLVPVILWADLALWHLPAGLLLREAVLQGLVSGVIAVMAFALAIRSLGARAAAAGAACVPLLAALGGWLWIGDPLSGPVLGLLVATIAGIALVNTAAPR